MTLNAAPLIAQKIKTVVATSIMILMQILSERHLAIKRKIAAHSQKRNRDGIHCWRD